MGFIKLYPNNNNNQNDDECGKVIAESKVTVRVGDVGLLEGKLVNLRVMEKEEIPLITEWWNSLEVGGDYQFFPQMSRAEMEKQIEQLSFQPSPFETKAFIIEKKDGTKIGYITYYPTGRLLEIGYAVVPRERGKGYCSEAAQIMVDYLFLSKDIARVQAHTNVRNMASQKVLEKIGFKKEGVERKSVFVRGEWRDRYLLSILREEWKEPKILTKPA